MSSLSSSAATTTAGMPKGPRGSVLLEPWAPTEWFGVGVSPALRRRNPSLRRKKKKQATAARVDATAAARRGKVDIAMTRSQLKAALFQSSSTMHPPCAPQEIRDYVDSPVLQPVLSKNDFLCTATPHHLQKVTLVTTPKVAGGMGTPATGTQQRETVVHRGGVGLVGSCAAASPGMGRLSFTTMPKRRHIVSPVSGHSLLKGPAEALQRNVTTQTLPTMNGGHYHCTEVDDAEDALTLGDVLQLSSAPPPPPPGPAHVRLSGAMTVSEAKGFVAAVVADIQGQRSTCG